MNKYSFHKHDGVVGESSPFVEEINFSFCNITSCRIGAILDSDNVFLILALNFSSGSWPMSDTLDLIVGANIHLTCIITSDNGWLSNYYYDRIFFTFVVRVSFACSSNLCQKLPFSARVEKNSVHYFHCETVCLTIMEESFFWLTLRDYRKSY